MGATEATVDEASLAQDVASVLGRLGSWESWEVETMLDGFFYDTCVDNLHDTYI